MISRTLRVCLALAVLLCLPLLTPTVEAQQDNQGFLYGRVVTNSGTEYVGFLRWGSQESSWDDLFNSVKRDLPFYQYLNRGEADRSRGRGTRVRVFDREMRVDRRRPSARQFISRFGDIASIEPRRRGSTNVVMRNGSEYEVSGGSSDVSDAIRVADAALGEIDLRWDRIERIDFMAAPRGEDRGVLRLYGTVETREGDFEGFIQWDQDETLGTDRLDGDTEDGDVAIRMGSIRSIERLSRRASMVTLNDGRELRLVGSNDVNEENRGIMVEDERFGRVTVHWQSFEQITFSQPESSGRGFADYAPLGDLDGTVVDKDGQRYSGRIVFDMDESEGWEMLNGNFNGIEFNIPLARVASVEPIRGGATRVVLVNGETLTLGDTHDVGENNSGALVFVGREPIHIAWRNIDRIEFNH
ncbi:MAG: hypothetical protein O6650_08510 [Actinobacteria bacterium]|nr:hypothetical protein [Actinomycetota bacterium]